jgi:hypothetical protein
MMATIPTPMSEIPYHSFPEPPKGGLPAHYATDKILFEELVAAGLTPDYDRTRIPCLIARKDRCPVAHLHVAAADIALVQGGAQAAKYLRDHLATRTVKRLVALYMHDGIGPGRRGHEAEATTREALGLTKDEIVYVNKPESDPAAREVIRNALKAIAG